MEKLHAENGEGVMVDRQQTQKRLHKHLHDLTVTIGERSVSRPENLKKTADYISSFYEELGFVVDTQAYSYAQLPVANIIVEISFGKNPRQRFLLGAHYDSVSGTVGADDNASAIAVQLEVARLLAQQPNKDALDLAVKFVSFALEEPPAYGTRHMGSRVYARAARAQKEKIDGMICLEMVGYACHEPGCQSYPFPLMFMDYPETGNFIGIVSNFKSHGFAKNLLAQFQKNKDLPAVKLTVPFNGYIMPAVRLSDHASFWDTGYKAVMVTDSAFFRNPYYHTAGDTMDKLDFEFMAEVVESLVIFFLSHQ
ncbi:MAG: M28 family peptidase [Desulfobacterales bacterium]|jgi:Zn-dependent M28 family amino/carboxypeptidase